MGPGDHKTFAQLMAVLAEVFGAEAPSKEKIEIYFRVLSDLSIADIDRAVLRILNSRTVRGTFPVPAEIREAAALGELEAIVAAAKVEGAIQRHGAYSHVAFDDPIIHAVISAMGGWSVFCTDDSQPWHFKQKEFIRLYTTLAKQPNLNYPPILYGLSDKSFTLGDEEIPLPIAYIGDQEMAKAIASKTPPQLPNKKDLPGRVKKLTAQIGNVLA